MDAEFAVAGLRNGNVETDRTNGRVPADACANAPGQIGEQIILAHVARIEKDGTRPALEKALKAAQKAKATLGEPHYKKVPKGFDADHPRADWLRWTHVGVMMKVDTPKLVHSAKFVKWCGDRIVKLAPVHTWLTSYVF